MMAEMTPDRLAELRRIAEAAKPGPWEWRMSKDGRILDLITLETGYNEEIITRSHISAWLQVNGGLKDFIPAFDPATALALLDRIEALEHKVVEHWEHCPPKERCEKCGFDPRLLSTLADRLGGVNDAAHKLWTTIGNVRADLLDAAWHMAWRRQRDDEGERSC